MPTEVILEAIPVAQPVPSRYDSAAQLLEQALHAGCDDANVVYLLALSYKHQGKPAESRAALRRIAQPDANVFLQMGLLSLPEQQTGQAEQEFARAWQMDPACYEAGYNLLLTRLGLGQIDVCVDLIPKVLALADGPDERRFLGLVQALLRSCQSTNGERTVDPLLMGLSAEDEQRLLRMLRSIGQLDIAYTLLRTLLAVRPDSGAVQEAYVEAGIVKAKMLMDRCKWEEAERYLVPLAQRKSVARSTQVALVNLLGCCACLSQDFEGGIRNFKAALKLAGDDARIYQNLALAYEWQGDLPQADPHWNRYFELIDRRLPAPPGRPGYLEDLAFESLSRLAGSYSEKERWSSALVYLERAHSLRPNDADTVERLFHLYNHVKCPDDARRVLEQLRELRPEDPQLELYEIDLIVPKNQSDVERMINGIERILQAHPNDARVEDRAVALVGSVLPLMGNLCDQLTEQQAKVVSQVRHLPSYQVNWAAVHEVMRDLHREFQKLRRITGKCLGLVKSEEHRRIVRELNEHIDRRIEVCRSMSR